MENIIKIVDTLLIDTNKLINEKMTGVAYLELFKFELINKFQSSDEHTVKELQLIFSNKKYIENEISIDNKNIKYKIEFFDKSISKIKQKTENDCLYLVLQGQKNITIYNNNGDTKSLYCKMLKNMGVVLGLNTFITAEIMEKSIVLLILNK
tara:strand:- start:383 stop:838 length:456 start_codon:yes stop_codon:yes gene_type:complete